MDRITDKEIPVTMRSPGKDTIMSSVGRAKPMGMIAAGILGIVALANPTIAEARGGFGGGGGFHGGGFGGGFHGGGFGGGFRGGGFGGFRGGFAGRGFGGFGRGFGYGGGFGYGSFYPAYGYYPYGYYPYGYYPYGYYGY